MAVSTKADMALIQGAKDVGESMGPADLSGLDKVTQAGVDMAVGALGEKRKIEQEKVDANDAFTDAANEVELASGSLGKVLYDDTVNFAEQAKNNYLTALKAGDQKGMMAAKKAMQDRSQFTQQHKTFTTELAKLQSEGDLSDAHTKEEVSYMTAVLKGNYKVSKNEKGQMVFDVNGEKKTNAEFEEMYILKNYELGKTVGELNAANKKSNMFDKEAIKNTIAQSLPKNVKEFRAALHDDLGGGASFKKLLETDTTLDDEVLMNIGNYDPNGDGKLDDTEKANFIKAITDHNDPNFNIDVSSKILAEKMTQAVENNHVDYWEKQSKAATKAEKAKVDAATKKFSREKELLKIKEKGANDRNELARKDSILKEKSIIFEQLDSSRFNTAGENILEKAFKDDSLTTKDKVNFTKNQKKVVIEETGKQIDFWMKHVDSSDDVRHLSPGEIKAEYGNLGTGSINSESQAVTGYYRIVREDPDDLTSRMIPVLINEGWSLDVNDLSANIDYNRGMTGKTGKKGSGKYDKTNE